MREALSRFVKEIKNPSDEFSPIPFWFLNDKLEKDTLRKQLEDFKDKGVNGVILHPRIGVPKELAYLSEEYFDIIKFIVETAKELNMAIVLYDEAMYPSGSAHGQVVATNPDFASIGLILTSDAESGKVIASFEDGQYLVQRKSGGNIRGIHFGEDDGEANAPASADILNPNAVECFIQLTHDKYYEHLKEYFGTTIIGFFTDEPCVLGRNTGRYRDWTDGLEKEIVEKGGDLKQLRGLFEKQENETTVLYHSIVKNRLNNVYYTKLSQWCESHKIALMGHPEKSNDIDEEKFFHIPGQDLIFRRVAPEVGGVDGMDSVQAKCSSDAARHMKRRRNSNECFGVCAREGIPWYITAGDTKWFIDWLAVRGVNLFIPHAFYYSVRGERSGERPPDVGPNNIWWEHYKEFSTYMKRVSYLVTDSQNGAKTAVLCESGAMPYEEVKPFYENQVEFNYLQENLFKQCKVENGKLTIAGYTYDYVMDPYDLANKYKLDISNVKRCEKVEDVVERDFITSKPCPGLRVTHLVKYGINLYFIVNEAEASIDCEASVPIAGKAQRMDLWKGEFLKTDWTQGDGSTKFHLTLEGFESQLILISEEQLPEEEILEEPLIVTLNHPWTMVGENKDKIQKIYETSYECGSYNGRETITVDGEEMIECYCNGTFVGVSFFAPHRFQIGAALVPEKNELKLVVTGNIANRYAGLEIPYGVN